jgi:microcystin-dependent protein
LQVQITNAVSSITTLTAKNTDISYTASPAVTSIANKLQTSVLAFSTSLNGISSTVFNYISGLTSDLSATLTSLSSSITTISNRQQIGSIMQHPKGNLTSPWLLANGQAVSRTIYSALFTSYGTLYGVGDGSTTFNLPNFQACFLRSYGAGITIGSSTYSTAAVGSAQNDAIQGHQHTPQSGQFLSTTLTSTSTNGVASVAIQKNNPSNFGNTGGVTGANSGSETVPTHHVVYTYILAL